MLLGVSFKLEKKIQILAATINGVPHSSVLIMDNALDNQSWQFFHARNTSLAWSWSLFDEEIMKSPLQISSLILVLPFLITPTCAQQMFVVGDSYSLGRFTDGPTWNEYYSDRVNWPSPVNFAGGGAGTGDEPQGGMTAQISQFLRREHVPTTDDLFAIWAGAADVLLLNETDMSIPVANLSGQVTKLAEAGAKQIVLGTLPLFGATDWGKQEERGRGVDLDVVSRDFSSRLKTATDQWRTEHEIDIFILDAFAIHEEILRDPIGTGFPDPELNGGLLLIDNIHFRTAFHELLSDQLYVTINGPDPGDFNGNGRYDLRDIERLLAADENDVQFDLAGETVVDKVDVEYWVHELKKTWFGDANLDGVFDSGDLVHVFGAGEYEDDVAMNSTWGTGDWNGDREFDSGDFIFAFTDGGYEQGQRSAANVVPEPSAAVLMLVAVLGTFRLRRKSHFGH